MSASAQAATRPAPLHFWLRQLSLVALADPPGSFADAATVIGRATGSRGLVLWESPEGSTMPGELSVLATWQHPSVRQHNETLRTDAVTHEAASQRTLALAQNGVSSLAGLAVDGALPVDYADGSRGVVTFCGSGELSVYAFETAIELLAILPDVFTVIRERRTLSLVNASDKILHQADLASANRPLNRTQLLGYFGEVCARLSAFLHDARISLHLRDNELDSGCPYAVCFPPEADLAADEGLAIDRLDVLGETDGQAEGPRISEELTNGNHVWGLLCCEPRSGPPAYLTHSDRDLLRPVASQLARYWENWLNRQAILEENESWRQLAGGMTNFNKTLTDALAKGRTATDRDPLLAAAALAVAKSVVPNANGIAVHLAPTDRTTDQLTSAAAIAYDGQQTSPAARIEAKAAFVAKTQRIVKGAPATTDHGSDSQWIVTTPIRVGQRVSGVLTAEGPGAEPPPNCAQVYDILSDQLGLFGHLAHTMDQLKSAKQDLQASLDGQADTMDDLKHQLVSPLRAATDRTDLVLRRGRFDRRTQYELEAARGLCRKASRVAMSAGVFATLSKEDSRPHEPNSSASGTSDGCSSQHAATVRP